MTRTTINKLTEAEKLALAERLDTFISCRADQLFTRTLIPAAYHQGLLSDLESEGFIRHDSGYVYPGPSVPKAADVLAIEARRNALLKASPVGRKILGLDQGTAPDAQAGLSPERRAALLSGSELGRGLLRNEAKAAEGKKA